MFHVCGCNVRVAGSEVRHYGNVTRTRIGIVCYTRQVVPWQARQLSSAAAWRVRAKGCRTQRHAGSSVYASSSFSQRHGTAARTVAFREGRHSSVAAAAGKGFSPVQRQCRWLRVPPRTWTHHNSHVPPCKLPCHQVVKAWRYSGIQKAG